MTHLLVLHLLLLLLILPILPSSSRPLTSSSDHSHDELLNDRNRKLRRTTSSRKRRPPSRRHTPAPTSQPLPSFLILLADDVGYGDVGYLNRFARGKTPNLDALAKGPNTLVLKSFRSEVACSPSRVALLTSRTPLRDCIQGEPLDTLHLPLFNSSSLSTVVQALKAHHPYKSSFFGKWPMSRYFPENWPHLVGFDEWITLNGGTTYDDRCFCFDHPNDYPTQCFLGHYWRKNINNHSEPFARPGDYSRAGFTCSFYARAGSGGVPYTALSDFPPGEMEGDHLFRLFKQWLETKTTLYDSFYSIVAFRSAHLPTVASPALREACANSTICNPSTFFSKGSLGNYTPKNRDKPALLNMFLDYSAVMASLDSAVGKFRELIRARYAAVPSLRDNIVIIFLSDNGPVTPGSGNGGGSNGPFLGGKHALRDGGIRVPFLLEYPKLLTRNVVSYRPVTMIDVGVTILDIAGVREGGSNDSPPPPRDGKSFYEELLLPPVIGTDNATMSENATSRERGGFGICTYGTWVDMKRGTGVCDELAYVKGDFKLMISKTKPHRLQPPFNDTVVVSGLYAVGEDDYDEKNDLSASLPEITAELRGEAVRMMDSVFGDYAANCAAYRAEWSARGKSKPKKKKRRRREKKSEG